MIKEKIDFLVNLSDDKWGEYAFSRDPLGHKVKKEVKQEMIYKANLCGKQEALKIRKMYPKLSIKEIAEKMNLKIKYEDSYGTDSFIMFACYNSPDKVTLFLKNIKLVEEFIKENGLKNLLNKINVDSLLLAHEMFHSIEENEPDIYTRTEKITLWKIESFCYKSKLVALGEIAAMAFAKELLSLPYNPYAFDVIMLYPHDEKKTDELFNELVEL